MTDSNNYISELKAQVEELTKKVTSQQVDIELLQSNIRAIKTEQNNLAHKLQDLKTTVIQATNELEETLSKLFTNRIENIEKKLSQEKD